MMRSCYWLYRWSRRRRMDCWKRASHRTMWRRAVEWVKWRRLGERWPDRRASWCRTRPTRLADSCAQSSCSLCSPPWCSNRPNAFVWVCSMWSILLLTASTIIKLNISSKTKTKIPNWKHIKLENSDNKNIKKNVSCFYSL